MKKFTWKCMIIAMAVCMHATLWAQDVYINLNSPRQGIDGVGFCHEGNREYGDNYVISASIQQMLDNHMTLFRDMFPGKTFSTSKGNYNYTDARIVNSFQRLKYMQDHNIKTILGIWDVPNWLVSNPGEGHNRVINNYDDFAALITAFLVRGKNNYGLKVDYIDINETKTSGINLTLTAAQYITFIQKCQALFTANGIETKVNLGSVLLWDLQYDKDIYNAVKNLSVAGYPSWHTYRGGSLHGSQREPESLWQGWGDWRLTIDRNLWGTETDYDAYYWAEKNGDVYTWTGAEEMAVMYYRNYYIARLSTSAGWFWHDNYPSHNVHIAYMNNFEPGGQVVETSQPSGDIMTVAYKHTANKKFVIQVLNQSSSAKTVNFYGVPAGKTLTLTRTSEAGDRYKVIGTFTPNGTTLTVTLQGNSFNTFVGELVTVVDTQAPTAPTNLTTTGKTHNTVSLSWTASTDNIGVAGYQVFGATNNLLGSSTGTTTTLQGLQPSMAYTLVAKAYDAAGNFSGASNAVTVTTDPAPTGVVTLYADCNYTGASVTLPVGNYTLAQLQALGGTNDNVSSLQVQSGYRAVLYADNNFAGTSLTVAASDACLTDNAFNDLTTSLRVEAIPSSTVIQAESYTNMSGVTTETTSDTGGGQNVGSLDANDWLSYDNINIPTAGTYTIQYRVASLNGGAQLRLEKGGTTTYYGTVTVPQTSGWQTWTTVQHTVTLTAGIQSFGIKALTSGANLNWWSISPGAAAARQADATAAPQEESTADVYPSPATSTLTVKTGAKQGTSTIDVLTLDGQKLYTTKIEGESGTISVSDIHYKGFVVVRISNQHRLTTVKVLLK